MLKTMLVVLSLATLLGGCTSASGPTFNAYSVGLANGEQTFRVDCYGLLENGKTCRRKALEICGDKAVHVLEAVSPFRRDASGEDRTRILTFQCGVPAQPPAAETPVSSQKITLNADANFAFDQATLMPAAKARLDQLVRDARGVSFRTVAVRGYTDSLGSDAYNEALSTRRADTVAEYLKTHGLHAQAFNVRGYGKAEPVASNLTDEGRAKNRRVEIVLDRE